MSCHEYVRFKINENQYRFKITEKDLYLNHGISAFMDETSKDFKDNYYRNNVHHFFLKNYYNEIDNPEKCIVLKGMALVEIGVYENIGHRSIGDIDLLVDDINYHSQKLEDLGFVEVKNNKWKANNFKRVFSAIISGIEIVVELHSRLFFSQKENINQAEKTPNGFYVLKHEEMLVHLVGHLAYQHTFLKLQWLLDIYLYIDKYESEIDFVKLEELFSKHHLKKSWVLTKKYMHSFFNGENKRRIRFLFQPTKNKLHYYFIKHMTKDSMKEALYYDMLWLLSKGWNT